MGADVAPVVAALTARRRATRISQREVARLMGTRQSAVSEIESGITRDPRWSTLVRFAAALGAELDVTVREVAASAAEPKASIK